MRALFDNHEDIMMNKRYQPIAAAILAALWGPCQADIADCAEPLYGLQQTVAMQPPADPFVHQQILQLQHDAEQFCLNGDEQTSIDKIGQAQALLPIGDLLPIFSLPQ